jgi:hypothetical protein
MPASHLLFNQPCHSLLTQLHLAKMHIQEGNPAISTEHHRVDNTNHHIQRRIPPRLDHIKDLIIIHLSNNRDKDKVDIQTNILGLPNSNHIRVNGLELPSNNHGMTSLNSNHTRVNGLEHLSRIPIKVGIQANSNLGMKSLNINRILDNGQELLNNNRILDNIQEHLKGSQIKDNGQEHLNHNLSPLVLNLVQMGSLGSLRHKINNRPQDKVKASLLLLLQQRLLVRLRMQQALHK